MMRKISRLYRHNQHSVGFATVNLLWIPKRRKKVLVGDVKMRLTEIIHDVAIDNQWVVKDMNIEPNYIHILVEFEPKTSINSVVKAFKAASSRSLRQEFPHLLKLPTLWTHAYLYDTRENLPESIIQEYINDPSHP